MRRCGRGSGSGRFILSFFLDFFHRELELVLLVILSRWWSAWHRAAAPDPGAMPRDAAPGRRHVVQGLLRW